LFLIFFKPGSPKTRDAGKSARATRFQAES